MDDEAEMVMRDLFAPDKSHDDEEMAGFGADSAELEFNVSVSSDTAAAAATHVVGHMLDADRRVITAFERAKNLDASSGHERASTARVLCQVQRYNLAGNRGERFRLHESRLAFRRVASRSVDIVVLALIWSGWHPNCSFRPVFIGLGYNEHRYTLCIKDPHSLTTVDMMDLDLSDLRNDFNGQQSDHFVVVVEFQDTFHTFVERKMVENERVKEIRRLYPGWTRQSCLEVVGKVTKQNILDKRVRSAFQFGNEEVNAAHVLDGNRRTQLFKHDEIADWLQGLEMRFTYRSLACSTRRGAAAATSAVERDRAS